MTHFEINHFNSEGNLFPFSPSSDSLQRICLIYNCSSERSRSVFQFLVKPSALADATVAAWDSSFPHVAQEEDWTMHWNPALRNLSWLFLKVPSWSE